MQNIYTYEDVARRYAVHRKTVEGWVREGRLGRLKIRGNTRFTEEHIFMFEKMHNFKALV